MSQERGREIVELVKVWIAERDAQADFSDYERQGKINRSALQKELSFSRSAFQTNADLVNIVTEAELRWFGETPIDIKSIKAAAERSEKIAANTNADNSKLIEELARLKAENNTLRRQLEKFKAMDEVIKSTGLVRL